MRPQATTNACGLKRPLTHAALGELKERLERVESKLGSVVASEAALARERDTLISWKLGVQLGLPELAGPSQVVGGWGDVGGGGGGGVKC